MSTIRKNKFSSGLKKLNLINISDNINRRKLELTKYSRYYLYFIIYSFAGWVWEKVFMLILDGTFQERGFLHIPICTIYGFVILCELFLFYKKNYPWTIIFFGSAFAASLLEFFTSWGMEKLFNRTWWDYSGWILNFQGRISLLTSIAFGIVSILVVNWIHPLLSRALDKYFPDKLNLKVSFALLTIITIDFIFTAVTMVK